jgi:hypothetical protein
MLVILSQKMDCGSLSADELFNSYRYSARYKNLIHTGDTFVYYHGNRHDKDQRFYYGIGTIGEILTTDGKNYYAKLLNCRQFEKNVPAILPDGGYVEQLGPDWVRTTANPSWQSPIRPLSQEAFDYILNGAGAQIAPTAAASASIDSLKEQLRCAVRDFFVEGNTSSIYRIESISTVLGRIVSVADKSANVLEESFYQPAVSGQDRLNNLLEYCRAMKMSYSYKAVLVLAFLHAADKNGLLSISKAVRYFKAYYNARRAKGFSPEKKKCIYQRVDISDQQIAENIIVNPVKALVESGFFFYNKETEVFSLSPEIWDALDRKSKAALTRICNQRLKDYFKD